MHINAADRIVYPPLIARNENGDLTSDIVQQINAESAS